MSQNWIKSITLNFLDTSLGFGNISPGILPVLISLNLHSTADRIGILNLDLSLPDGGLEKRGLQYDNL